MRDVGRLHCTESVLPALARLGTMPRSARARSSAIWSTWAFSAAASMSDTRCGPSASCWRSHCCARSRRSLCFAITSFSGGLRACLRAWAARSARALATVAREQPTALATSVNVASGLAWSAARARARPIMFGAARPAAFLRLRGEAARGRAAAPPRGGLFFFLKRVARCYSFRSRVPQLRAAHQRGEHGGEDLGDGVGLEIESAEVGDDLGEVGGREHGRSPAV